MRVPLVLARSADFASVGAALARLGYRHCPDPHAPPPLAPGDPDDAAWSRPDDDTRLQYTFDPALSLRALAAHGAQAPVRVQEIARALPTMHLDDIRRCLCSGEPIDQLFGIAAASHLRDTRLGRELIALSASRDSAVAAAAQRVLAELGGDALGDLGNHLRTRRAERPGHSALFPLVGDAVERRQVLRWLPVEVPVLNPHVLEILRTALDDADWEVRLTAMLIAARMDARELRSQVNRVPLAVGPRDGFNEADRALVNTLRHGVLLLLDRTMPAPSLTGPVPDAEDAWSHVLRCIVGAPVGRVDHTFLFAHSLVTPLPEFDPPVLLPPAIVERDGRYFIAGLDIEMVWVAAVEHWLGDDTRGGTDRAPIRHSSASEAGFFATRSPLSSTLGDALLHDGLVPRSGSSPTAFFSADLATAHQVCAKLAGRIGAPVTLSTSDEWEMCARGPDARRLPWGNGLPTEPQPLTSPWGAEALIGAIGQWTRDSSAGAPIVRGTERARRCADFEVTSPSAPHGVRPVIRPPT